MHCDMYCNTCISKGDFNVLIIYFFDFRIDNMQKNFDKEEKSDLENVRCNIDLDT